MKPIVVSASCLPTASSNDAAPPIPDAGILLSTHALSKSSANSPAAGAALVLYAQLRTDRFQRPYVVLTLRCADATVIEARWWQFPHAADLCPREGAVYHFTGWLEAFNGTQQLRLTDAYAVPDADLTPFAPSIQRPLAELLAEYDARVAELDAPLAELIRHTISNQIYERFCTWPAAQYLHGALRHGLLAHSLRVATLAESLADSYGPAGFPHDHSLVVAAALLHDIGKTQTLPSIAGSALPAVASSLDHVTLSVLMVQSAADHLAVPIASERLASLLHAILAHHGRIEWGAPIEPQTAEAWLVHLADYAESRLWRYSDDAPPNHDCPQNMIDRS
jgi:3'-5' exoribonuclease